MLVEIPKIETCEYLCCEVKDDGALKLMGAGSKDLIEGYKLPQLKYQKKLAKKIKEICAKGQDNCIITILKCEDKELIFRAREGKFSFEN